MKKVVRMLGLCALVALAFTSCKKNETNSVTFKASVAQPQSNERTYITQLNKLGWSTGDEIKVFNNTTTNYDFTVGTISNSTVNPTNNLNREANFVVNDAEKVAFLKDIEDQGKYVAFYPEADFDGTDSVTMEIPDHQYFDFEAGHGGSFTTNTYPMFGKHDAANHFQFYSHAGVLQFNFGRNEGRYVNVKSITVTAPEGDQVVGKMKYLKDYPFTANTSALENYANDDAYKTSSTSNVVTFDCGDGAELPAPTDSQQGQTLTFIRFDIAMLRGALTEGFHVIVRGDKNDLNNPEAILEDVILLDSLVPANNRIGAQVITLMPNLILPAYGPGEGDGSLPE